MLFSFTLGTLELVQTQYVCFQGKGNTPGTFTFHLPTGDYKLKLSHLFGGISCYNDYTLITKFGCKSPQGNQPMYAVITDERNNTLLPGPNGYLHDGNDGNSEYILFNDIIRLQQGKQFRIWSKEDLLDSAEADNIGLSCTYVLARKEH